MNEAKFYYWQKKLKSQLPPKITTISSLELLSTFLRTSEKKTDFTECLQFNLLKKELEDIETQKLYEHDLFWKTIIGLPTVFDIEP